MQRLAVEMADDDSDVSSLMKEEVDVYDKETSSEMPPSLRDEFEVSTNNLVRSFDTDDFVRMAGARTLVDRLCSILHVRRGMSSLSLDGDYQEQRSSTFLTTVRTIFNYPEPGLELRGTAWLDGLRGLAAFEVFIFHYDDGWVDRTLGWGHGEYLDPAWWRAPFFRTFYASGDAAVCLFFAISGYVLSHRILSLYRQQRHEEAYSSLSSALFRRAIRLYMPVAIETFILMLLCRWFNFPKPVVYTSADTFLGEIKNWITAFVHLLLPLRYPDRWDYLIDKYDGGISWTIPLEYYGSVVVFIALLFVSRIRSMSLRIGLVLVMVAQSFIKDDWIAGQFLLGMCFADYQLGRQRAQEFEKRGVAHQRHRIRALLFGGIFIFGFYLAGMPLFHAKAGLTEDDHPIWSRPSYDWITQPFAALGMYNKDRQMDRYLQCLAGFSIVVGVGETSRLRRLMETRFVQYLGRISFGLYLCHIFLHAWLKQLDKYYIMLVGLDPSILPHEREESVRLFLAYLLMIGPSILLNFFVGGCFERFLDRPSVNMGKRFEKWCLSIGKDEDVATPHLPHFREVSLTEVPTVGSLVLTTDETAAASTQLEQHPLAETIHLR